MSVVAIARTEMLDPPESTVHARSGDEGALANRGRSMQELPVGAARTGDARAVREVVECLTPDAFRVAVSVLGERHPGLDDAVQMGMLTVLKQLHSYRGEGGFRSFAMRIVSRTALAVRRSDKRNAKLVEKLRSSEDVPPEDAVDDTADPVDGSLRRVLSELLQTLPEEQVETLLLRVVLEYELGEVASETGVPVNTVRSRLRLAREALRRRIEAAPDLMELARDRGLTSVKGGCDGE